MTKRTVWLIVAMAGVAAAILGTALGALAIALLPATGAMPDGRSLLSGAALVALALGLGIPVAYHGWSGARGKPTRRFAPKSAWWLGVLLALSIILGWLVTRLPRLDILLLPPLHVVAMALPPLILVSLTGRALRGMGGSWREVVVSLGGGGLLAPVLSLILEALVLLALAAAAAVVVLAVPGGTEWASGLIEGLGDPAVIGDSSGLLQLLLNRVVALGVVVVVGIAMPLVEEALKTLAVGVAGAWMRPKPARGFLWGVASGAGFAIAENLLNGAVAGQTVWAYGAASRAAATTLHCFTGGLVGWGWGQLWSGRRVMRFFGSLAAAVVLHGLWNTIAVGAFVLGIASGVQKAGSVRQIAAVAGMATLLGLLGVLAVALAIALPLIGRRLAVVGGSGVDENDRRVITRDGIDARPPDGGVVSA